MLKGNRSYKYFLRSICCTGIRAAPNAFDQRQFARRVERQSAISIVYILDDFKHNKYHSLMECIRLIPIRIVDSTPPRIIK